jgi:hypothetical protein
VHFGGVDPAPELLFFWGGGGGWGGGRVYETMNEGQVPANHKCNISSLKLSKLNRNLWFTYVWQEIKMHGIKCMLSICGYGVRFVGGILR